MQADGSEATGVAGAAAKVVDAGDAPPGPCPVVHQVLPPGSAPPTGASQPLWCASAEARAEPPAQQRQQGLDEAHQQQQEPGQVAFLASWLVSLCWRDGVWGSSTGCGDAQLTGTAGPTGSAPITLCEAPRGAPGNQSTGAREAGNAGNAGTEAEGQQRQPAPWAAVQRGPGSSVDHLASGGDCGSGSGGGGGAGAGAGGAGVWLNVDDVAHAAVPMLAWLARRTALACRPGGDALLRTLPQHPSQLPQETQPPLQKWPPPLPSRHATPLPLPQQEQRAPPPPPQQQQRQAPLQLQRHHHYDSGMLWEPPPPALLDAILLLAYLAQRGPPNSRRLAICTITFTTPVDADEAFTGTATAAASAISVNASACAASAAATDTSATICAAAAGAASATASATTASNGRDQTTAHVAPEPPVAGGVLELPACRALCINSDSDRDPDTATAWAPNPRGALLLDAWRRELPAPVDRLGAHLLWGRLAATSAKVRDAEFMVVRLHKLQSAAKKARKRLAESPVLATLRREMEALRVEVAMKAAGVAQGWVELAGQILADERTAKGRGRRSLAKKLALLAIKAREQQEGWGKIFQLMTESLDSMRAMGPCDGSSRASEDALKGTRKLLAAGLAARRPYWDGRAVHQVASLAATLQRHEEGEDAVAARQRQLLASAQAQLAEAATSAQSALSLLRKLQEEISAAIAAKKKVGTQAGRTHARVH
ncbi:hypothetical protein GPECTOR_44g23 [Gonium pectorale]|uniref:Uncharacterized protein n=1 Tax=Gonium pectorale TaxID=33097 RepID=A0A150G930_GONPE|nr:hypothetical protein GPECTOR_44g23 [Gonium pectorale]|eukprot:KXZ46344.1 hypothetical protein GPECTOR_44g23 [Gonium pectorale]